MIPKLRLDALTDGVFAVAMTLLVFDLRLPDNFHPQDNAALLHLLIGLGHQVLVYVVSFYVLALCWLGHVRTAAHGEQAMQRHIAMPLSYLLLITFLPFATMVVGRFPGFPAAVWLYAANMTLLALVALRMVAMSSAPAATKQDARIGLITLIVAAAVTVGLSLVLSRWAMFGYLINFLENPAQRLWRRFTSAA